MARPHVKNILTRVPASFDVLEGARRRLVVENHSSDEQHIKTIKLAEPRGIWLILAHTSSLLLEVLVQALLRRPSWSISKISLYRGLKYF